MADSDLTEDDIAFLTQQGRIAVHLGDRFKFALTSRGAAVLFGEPTTLRDAAQRLFEHRIVFLDSYGGREHLSILDEELARRWREGRFPIPEHIRVVKEWGQA